MEIEKVFNDLESNQNYECDEAKKKLVELVTQIKEQWLVHNMMEYYLKTGSTRIIDVLVKVQTPHDIFIFDRLSDWLKTQSNRVHALNLFCFVIRKHPTWLFKVEKHRLIKDIFKLMLTEKEIVPLMSALLCIITLLPIIPNLVPNFLNDLFEIFGHLASWNFQNATRLQDDKLVHLQLGLQMLFHRLYGMYPWNFLAYISDFIKKEKGPIFYHTIQPLLATVRLHPMLVTATTESEISHSRWKEMEPHDVVIECANLSLPVMNQDFNVDHTTQISTDLLDTPGGIRATHAIQSMLGGNTTTSSGIGHSCYQFKDLQYRCGPSSRFEINNTNIGIWSPYNEITTSGPIPLTPTPAYTLPLSASAAVVNLNNQLLGITGSSPPEAAVEATPETTPMKDIKDTKKSMLTSIPPIVTNPLAVRAILVASQPSSPMRKEYHNQFSFPETAAVSSSTTSTTVIEQEVNTRLVTRVTTYDRKLQQMIQDRTHSQNSFQTIEAQGSKQGCRTPIEVAPKNETPDVDSEMLNIINSSSTLTPKPTPIPTPTEHIIKICDNCNENDRSMCTAGGLQIPTSRSMQLLAKGIKRRNRMASYCYNDSSCEKTGSTQQEKNLSLTVDTVKVRRTKSCSSICSAKPPDDETDDCSEILKNVAVHQQNNERRLQKSGKMLAIATATKNVSTTQNLKINAATQTVVIMAQNYENSLFEMLVENKNLRNAYESKLQYPQKILNHYILRSKENFDVGYRSEQDQYHLLCLQLQYERYRREMHAERNRRLWGRSRVKLSLEMERDRLREQLKSFETKNNELVFQIDKTMKSSNEREQHYIDEITMLKKKFQNEIEINKCLRQDNEQFQTRINEELTKRKEINYELESLRGQIFSLNTELQHAHLQVEMGLQYKQELARLEAEFIIMGEVQVKCRDRLAEMDNYKARDEELQMLQDTYNAELKDLKSKLEEKLSQMDSAKHKIIELQTQLVNNEKVITEQKRLLKTVKDEYEERFKALSKKYDVQKSIIIQMEEKMMMSFHKPQAAIGLNTCSPDTDKTDFASSTDRNSPLSTSLASSGSLSASLRSTDMRNLQQLVEIPIPETGSSSINVINTATGNSNIIEGTPIPTFDLASSAHTATVSAINIVTASTSKSATGGAESSFNFDSPVPTTSHHTHPHLHLQQTHQQQQQKQKR